MVRLQSTYLRDFFVTYMNRREDVDVHDDSDSWERAAF